MIDYGWLLKNRSNFVFLCVYPVEQGSRMLLTKYIKMMFEEFYGPYLWMFMKSQVIPSLLYCLITLQYLSAIINEDYHNQSDEYKFFVRYITGSIILALMGILLYNQLYKTYKLSIRWGNLSYTLGLFIAVPILCLMLYGPIFWIIIQNMIEVDEEVSI